MARDPEATPASDPRKRKSVRFGDCPGPAPPGSPVSMVQSLVPHLPGLDPEALYVISGPFPQYEAGSATPTVLIMATPVPAGVAVVARPSGPPPTKGAKGTLTAHFPSVGRPSHAPPCHKPAPPTSAPSHCPPSSPGPQGHRLQMMHWDLAHPTGHSIPLRQPNPPVYYSVPAHGDPSHDMSGSQSPAMSSEETGSEDGASNHGDPGYGQEGQRQEQQCQYQQTQHQQCQQYQQHYQQSQQHYQQCQQQYQQYQQHCQQQYQQCQPLFPVHPFQVLHRD